MNGENAAEAVVDRDVPVGAAEGVWSVTLYAEHSEIIDGWVLPTRDATTDPLGEATQALLERGYAASDWRHGDGTRWVTAITRRDAGTGNE